jgi:hypothetical protein
LVLKTKSHSWWALREMREAVQIVMQILLLWVILTQFGPAGKMTEQCYVLKVCCCLENTTHSFFFWVNIWIVLRLTS